MKGVLLSKEESVDKKADAVERREAECTAKVAELQKREKKVEELEQKGVQELERISGLTSDQAKDELLRSCRRRCQSRRSQTLQGIREQSKR